MDNTTNNNNILDVSGNANFKSISINNNPIGQFIPNIFSGKVDIGKCEIKLNITLTKNVEISIPYTFTAIPHIFLTVCIDDDITMGTSVGNILVYHNLIKFDISISTIGLAGPSTDFYVSYMIIGL